MQRNQNKGAYHKSFLGNEVVKLAITKNGLLKKIYYIYI